MSEAKPSTFLSNAQLEKSSVVANSRMNRARGLAGANSYEKELGLNPVTWLRSRSRQAGHAAWLDLCCGRGEALVEASQAWSNDAPNLFLHGVDLVGMLRPTPRVPWLKLEVASLHEWSPPRRYDLITCVHGLHYIGDKLGLVEHAISWLEPNGYLLAHLDLDNLRGDNDRPLGSHLRRTLESNGCSYHRRKRLLSRSGNAPCTFGYRYRGADDRAGANYTGQEAVHSYYSIDHSAP
ncbi:MAG: class I SAM-dependent methyltransferase [Pirellulales bacterium]|nr:class I SAM-dependent methyltransferase [Pirellulales bacterium]